MTCYFGPTSVTVNHFSAANERAAGADVRLAHGAERDDLRLITAHH